MRLWRKRPVGECPGCGAHVIADNAFLADARFSGPVQFAGDAHLSGCFFDYPNQSTPVAFKAGGMMTLTHSTIHAGAGITLGGGGMFPAASLTPGLSRTTSPAPAELELMFGVEAIVAWRAWTLVDFAFRGGATEKRLAPYSANLPWEPMERMEAVCTQGRHHEAPWQSCSCGIWAVRDRETAKGVGPAGVIGSVYLWGRVLEFERGYRAQFAYPKELIAPDQETADELGRTYGIPANVIAE